MAKFRFTVGPWNIHEGHETFGPGIRPTVPFEEKIRKFAEIGMDGVQFHDDDAVPDMNNMSEKAIIDYAKDVKKIFSNLCGSDADSICFCIYYPVYRRGISFFL